MPAFHDVRFPTNISRGMTGGPSFQTIVIPSESGWEQRIQNWDQARLKWDFGAGIWDEARAQELLAFFRARKGRAYGFRFKDWSDYYAGMTMTPGGLAYLPAAQAQQIGVGDGSTYAFQLQKTYASGGVTDWRPITRPVSGTVKVYVAGAERLTGWTLNHATGVLTFDTAPTAGQVVAWAGQFDIPARFDTDELKISLDGIFAGDGSASIVEIRERPGVVPAQWSPLFDADLAAWYDLSDLSTLFQDNGLATPVTTSGQSIGGILDKSPWGRHLTQVNAARRPVYQASAMNSRPGAVFDGSDDRVQSSLAWTITQPYTAFVVYQRNQAGTYAIDGASASNRLILFTAGAGPFWGANAGVNVATTTTWDTASHVHAVRMDHGGGEQDYWLDGTALGSIYHASGSNNLNGITLGSGAGGAQPLGGVIQSVLLFAGRKSSDEMARISAYLKARWGTP